MSMSANLPKANLALQQSQQQILLKEQFQFLKSVDWIEAPIPN
jgi:hypothetical protein